MSRAQKRNLFLKVKQLWLDVCRFEGASPSSRELKLSDGNPYAPAYFEALEAHINAIEEG